MAHTDQSSSDQPPGGLMVDHQFLQHRIAAEVQRRGKTDTIQVGDVTVLITAAGIMLADQLIPWDDVPAVITTLGALYTHHTGRQP